MNGQHLRKRRLVRQGRSRLVQLFQPSPCVRVGCHVPFAARAGCLVSWARLGAQTDPMDHQDDVFIHHDLDYAGSGLVAGAPETVCARWLAAVRLRTGALHGAMVPALGGEFG